MGEAERLDLRVVRPLRERIGNTLKDVTYRCLELEAGPSDIYEADFYLGGEILLLFSGGPLYVSWDENAGWAESHFSVQASHSSLFLPDWSFESFDGALVTVWRPHLGTVLQGAQVLGWDRVPYAILFSFPHGSVVAGSSWRTRFGDGDDLHIRDASGFDALETMETLWSSPPAVA